MTPKRVSTRQAARDDCYRIARYEGLNAGADVWVECPKRNVWVIVVRLVPGQEPYRVASFEEWKRDHP